MNLKIKSIDESQKKASNILFVCMSFESIRWKKYLETNNNYQKYSILLSLASILGFITFCKLYSL